MKSTHRLLPLIGMIALLTGTKCVPAPEPRHYASFKFRTLLDLKKGELLGAKISKSGLEIYATIYVDCPGSYCADRFLRRDQEGQLHTYPFARKTLRYISINEILASGTVIGDAYEGEMGFASAYWQDAQGTTGFGRPNVPSSYLRAHTSPSGHEWLIFTPYYREGENYRAHAWHRLTNTVREYLPLDEDEVSRLMASHQGLSGCGISIRHTPLRYRAICWEQPGVARALRVPTGTTQSFVEGMSIRGTWKAGAIRRDDRQLPVLWKNEQSPLLLQIPTEEYEGSATDVRENGEAVGWLRLQHGGHRAVRWDRQGRVFFLDQEVSIESAPCGMPWANSITETGIIKVLATQRIDGACDPHSATELYLQQESARTDARSE